MSDAPAPLTPPDCDLRDFAFMPLEVRRLLTSETWVLGTAEEKVAALSLWCEAWHQVPAASLPDNERMLAHLSGAGSGWRKVREHALRGWVKCADGRLYHPVVAEKANESWAKKEAQRERSRRANAARWGSGSARRDVPGGVETDRGGPAIAGSDDAGRNASGLPEASRKDAHGITQGLLEASHNDPKGQGQGEREGEIEEPPTPTPDGVGGQNASQSEGRPPGWRGQWKGLRANGSNPRSLAAAEAAARPPPPEPDHALWPALKARGVTPADFRAWVAPLASVPATTGRTVFVAPSRFVADRVRADWTEHLAAATGGPVEIRGPIETAAHG